MCPAPQYPQVLAVGPQERFISGKGSCSDQTDLEHGAGQVPSLPEGPGQNAPIFPLLPQGPTGSQNCLLLPGARGGEKWSCLPSRPSELPEVGAGVQTQRVHFNRWELRALHRPRSSKVGDDAGVCATEDPVLRVWAVAPASVHGRTSRHTTLSSDTLFLIPGGVDTARGSQAQRPRGEA